MYLYRGCRGDWGPKIGVRLGSNLGLASIGCCGDPQGQCGSTNLPVMG